MFRCFSGKKTKRSQLSNIEKIDYTKKYRFLEEEIEAFKRRFDRMAGGQTVNLQRFKESMGFLGLDSTAVIAERIFSVMDSSNSGQVSFDEFLQYMDLLENGTEDEKAELSFKFITYGDDRPFTFEDFCSWVYGVIGMYSSITGGEGSGYSQQRLQNYFDILDANKDGLVSKQEYMEAMMTHSEWFEWFDFVNNGLSDQFQEDGLQVESTEEQKLQNYINTIENEVIICLDMLTGKCPVEFQDNAVDVPTSTSFALSPRNLGFSNPLAYAEFLDDDEVPNKPDVDVGEAFSDSDSSDYLSDEEVKTPKFKLMNNWEEQDPKRLKVVSQRLQKLLGFIKSINKNQRKSSIKRKDSVTNIKNVPKPINKAIQSKKSFVHWGDDDWDVILGMMIGIQKSVKFVQVNLSTQAEPSRVDFKEKCKYNLAPGNDTLKSQWKFRDYAPSIFERIRRRFGIQSKDYIKSIGVDHIMRSLSQAQFKSLIGLCSTGKSGSFFYYSSDGKYMVKTISRAEYLLFKKILPSYYYHMMQNPDTLAQKFYGFHKLRLDYSTSVYFVVQSNLFNSGIEIQDRYDLKGSTQGRSTAVTEDQSVARKDLDFIAKQQPILLGSDRKQQLMAQIYKDAEFFKRCKIIDYSLLLGIHEIQPGEKFDKIDKKAPFAQQNGGGLISTDKKYVYFMGIIDTLTVYKAKKKLEHFFKGTIYGRDQISCIPPSKYSERFVSFMDRCII